MFSIINIFDLSEGEIISILCWKKFAFLRRSTFLILYETWAEIWFSTEAILCNINSQDVGQRLQFRVFFHFLFVIFYWSNFRQNEVGGFWARWKQLGYVPPFGRRAFEMFRLKYIYWRIFKGALIQIDRLL